jgi:hypothetical protein
MIRWQRAAQAGVTAGAEMEIAETAERVQVGEPEMIAGQCRPLLVEAVGEEVAAVKAIGGFILPGRPVGVARLLAVAAVLHPALEFLDIQPQPEIGVNPIGATAVLDHRQIRVGAQRPPQPVDRDVQAVS